MFNGIFDQANYAAAKRMLDATALRHEALAGNLANVETPGYKRLDVDSSFESSLKQALRQGDARALSALEPRLSRDTSSPAVSEDGNNVQLEKEMMALQENTMAHAVETHLVTASLLKLRLAITGRTA